ncbi:MAG TPA: SpoIIE family protein phosphatase [Vicinamibacteria bacterium]|nr:SpoIIE family protein phosphatase [Vicinamibacteria bacterium]
MNGRIPRWIRRGLVWGAALALSAASLAHTALWLYFSNEVRTTLSEDLGLPRDRLLEPPVRLGFQLRYVAERGVRVVGVDAGGPAAKAGLRVDDVIVAVDGRSLAESAAPFLAAYRSARPGDSIEFTVARPGEAETTVVRGTLDARPLGDRIVPALQAVDRVLRLFPLLFLAVALPVLFLRIEDPHAWRVAVLLVCIAGLARTPTAFANVGVPAFAFAMAWKGACNGLVAFFFYQFFSRFPTRSRVDRRLPWLQWVLLALGLLFALGGVGLGRPGHAGLPAPLAAVLGDALTPGLWFAYNYGGIALSLACLVATAVSSPSPEARRKIRVLVWGALAGLAPVVLVNVLSDFEIWRAPGWVTTLVYLMIVLFPLSFAYAVVKHRVLELPVLLKRSARYVLVKRGFAVLLVLLGAGASAFVALSFDRLLRVEASLATTAGVGFGFLLAGVAAPAVRRTTRFIDRSFFRDAYDVHLILQDLVERTRNATSREELGALLRRQLDEALHPASIVVYLADADGRLHSDDSPVPAGLRDIPKDAPGLADLARRGRPWQVSPERNEVASVLEPLGPDCLVPVVSREGRLLGLAVLGPRLSEEPYSADDERLLGSVASQAGVTLENMALAARIAERLQAEHQAAHEMELARQVQAKLLPQSGPWLLSLEYAGRCVQARAVGGDYYDFLDAGEGRVGLVLADVSGKGFASALLVASLHASLRSQSPRAGDLESQLRTVNRLLYESTETNRYATLFLGLFDDTDRRLRYANCGHNPPLLLRRDGSVEKLAPTAMVVGLVEDWTAGTDETLLSSGDILAIYSDGLTEATDQRGEEFGEAGLVRTLQANRDREVRALLDAVFEEVRRFSDGEQADDQTMVIARVRA